MQHLMKRLPAAVLGLTLAGSGAVQAFSFSMGDDWGPTWGNPYWGAPMYSPWHMPHYHPMPPRLSSYDRTRLKFRRQSQMDDHQDAIEDLNDMLFGSYGFDRTKAIKLARKIEASSGAALSHNFHPGSIATFNSHATPAVWQNQDAFKANAKALQEAAKALALELEKRPTVEEGAILLKTGNPYEPERTTEPVSPAVWGKFNDLSGLCFACHQSFRGPAWD